ncbi:uncharacterized protein A1O5_08168 [Cladophialophora psammophila CBS 110553]|uniref:SWR1-complex protein 5 n=1 Tax=Cladophialophora psammophila CBS 110553 TaxID=1182543 RepID=W9WUT2_9EURO|nr:uncharacterized protein A1O5_08168 [Cladophialophora psammophila CBS 110553]EXJ68376.1 hypothetical protein A1O5_08168 [Cladophialophora psammophila CBS 110553]
MTDLQDHDMNLEEDYDEEADSDFEGDGSGREALSSSSDDDDRNADGASRRPRKRQKTEKSPTQEELITELDSGDEVTIREQKKARRKGKRDEHNGDDSEGWRARTRTMRTKEEEERSRNRPASSKGSILDVNKIWEEMNQPGPLPPPCVEGDAGDQTVRSRDVGSVKEDTDKENVPDVDGEETITIKRTYKFAGEIHVEEKTVPKSSAEARLWLSQQDSSKSGGLSADGKVVNRPLRKISRFDPNFNNAGAFRGSWTSSATHATQFKGPKLNVVEKSKMDWAEHVDTEGLQEELDTHAKAKEGYLTRMDFLKQVEERREAEARLARTKGR